MQKDYHDISNHNQFEMQHSNILPIAAYKNFAILFLHSTAKAYKALYLPVGGFK